ncbi:uncharacterized protein LAESUDRAFT_290078 [Laetiporus sulphureus 93-53]|uniref:Uncharacterized protein n=1 Tax=Laetiporus sulphureus 93-53 TaxID=1314785 RepID=A0A165DDK6_9APHY|nr:uncharacterized protein LAESUDRAFT_290078 [Laetiporus sulphureus 93-53]KZT04638.1 hypothetical protein LAESUDRAFT_290078 [Laetiporus sulphureus 93-53]
MNAGNVTAVPTLSSRAAPRRVPGLRATSGKFCRMKETDSSNSVIVAQTVACIRGYRTSLSTNRRPRACKAVHRTSVRESTHSRSSA